MTSSSALTISQTLVLDSRETKRGGAGGAEKDAEWEMRPLTPFVGVLRVKQFSSVRFFSENTMALFRANGPPIYQPWATPKETHPTARLRTESPPQNSV